MSKDFLDIQATTECRFILNTSELWKDILVTDLDDLPDLEPYNKHKSCYAIYRNLGDVGKKWNLLNMTSSRDKSSSGRFSLFFPDHEVVKIAAVDQKSNRSFYLMFTVHETSGNGATNFFYFNDFQKETTLNSASCFRAGPVRVSLSAQ